MYKYLFLSIILSSGTAWAEPTSVACDLCRDVYQFPDDYANHAYNQVFGEDPVLSFIEGDTMLVVATNGQWAIVDLNYILEPTGWSLSILILSHAISIPNGRIEMIVQDPRNTISSFQAFTHSPDLLVGDGSTPPPAEDTSEEELVTEKADSHGGGQEIVCCQEGAYYWYADQVGFNIQIGNE